ncbi:hypothetical protein EW053_33475 [Streptomyces sp. IB2014 016-6]|nr:hypothetical protein EW053_33475 [Streptomyces sp. IB2014 016-6]
MERPADPVKVIYPWARRVVPLGSPTHGRDWSDTYSTAEEEYGRRLTDLRDVPVLALFGERGTGKSVALNQECRALESGRQEPRWVNLWRHQTESQATSALAAFAAPVAGEWWVILDSLDEGLNVLPALGSLIADRVDALAADERACLRLRISCRTGRWPEILQDTLTQHWPSSQVQHAVLAPLSAQDIAVAAEGSGLDARAFAAELRHRGLNQLARTPVTLLQLLDHHRAHGALPATAADAYLQACVRLCSETRRPADIREWRAQPTGEHLLPVAARVAAVMQFGAHFVLCDDWQHEGGDGDVSLAELEGGHEPGPLGSPVSCTTDKLRRLTESHLFEPVGLQRWSFTHRSYQEFLAAQYLSAHQVDPKAQAGLLWVGEGPARHIYPAHREVAAWRSGDDSSLFEDLLRDDPQVLLLADLPARSAGDRARVVDAVFRLVQRDDTTDIDRTSLHRLDHPGLPEQLLPRLCPDTHGFVLYTALGMARRCPHPELTDALLHVAETAELPEELRAVALRSVVALDQTTSQTIDRIRQLAAGDASAEVVAAALNRLWPAHLTVSELLDLFRDSAPDYIGGAWALRSDIPAQLTASQTVQALFWARDTLREPPSQRSVLLAVSLITSAVTLAGTTGLPGRGSPEEDIGQALAALGAHSRTLHSLDGHTEQEELGDTLRAQHSLRRALTSYLLTHTTEEDFIGVLTAVPHGCLITYGDAFHWMDHWEELAEAPPSLARLTVSITPPDDPELRARAAAARVAHPTLRAVTFHWDEPTAPEPHQEPDNVPDPKFSNSDAALREALAAVRTADPDTIRHAWATVIDRMRITHDGSRPPPIAVEPLFTWAHHAPSRPAEGSDLESQLHAAALQVLAAPARTPARPRKARQPATPSRAERLRSTAHTGRAAPGHPRPLGQLGPRPGHHPRLHLTRPVSPGRLPPPLRRTSRHRTGPPALRCPPARQHRHHHHAPDHPRPHRPRPPGRAQHAHHLGRPPGPRPRPVAQRDQRPGPRRTPRRRRPAESGPGSRALRPDHPLRHP